MLLLGQGPSFFPLFVASCKNLFGCYFFFFNAFIGGVIFVFYGWCGYSSSPGVVFRFFVMPFSFLFFSSGPGGLPKCRPDVLRWFYFSAQIPFAGRMTGTPLPAVAWLGWGSKFGAHTFLFDQWIPSPPKTVPLSDLDIFFVAFGRYAVLFWLPFRGKLSLEIFRIFLALLFRIWLY